MWKWLSKLMPPYEPLDYKSPIEEHIEEYPKGSKVKFEGFIWTILKNYSFNDIGFLDEGYFVYHKTLRLRRVDKSDKIHKTVVHEEDLDLVKKI